MQKPWRAPPQLGKKLSISPSSVSCIELSNGNMEMIYRV
jgi:hypothetical protein